MRHYTGLLGQLVGDEGTGLVFVGDVLIVKVLESLFQLLGGFVTGLLFGRGRRLLDISVIVKLYLKYRYISLLFLSGLFRCISLDNNGFIFIA